VAFSTILSSALGLAILALGGDKGLISSHSLHHSTHETPHQTTTRKGLNSFVMASQLNSAMKGIELDDVLNFCKKNSIFYRQKLRHIESFDELVEHKIFTYKDDIRKNPYQFITASMNNMRAIFTSSGTTGSPTLSFYTLRDLSVIDVLASKVMRRIKICPSDVGVINAPFEMVMPGHVMMRMLILSGVTAVPLGAFMPDARSIWDLSDRLNATIYMGYPSALMTLIEKNIDRLDNHSYRLAIMGGEVLSNARRKQLEKILKIDIFDSYGMSEIFAPLGGECVFKCGMHIASDIVYAEVVDPNTKEPVLSKVKEGVLVLTSLKREGMRLLRYWTNDYVILDERPCKCGEHTPRIIFKGRLNFAVNLKDRLITTRDIEEAVLSVSDNIWEYAVLIQKKGRKISRLKIIIEPFYGRTLSKDCLNEIRYTLGQLFNAEVKVEKTKFGGIKRMIPKRKRLFLKIS